jgi:hypothetical protein
MQDDVGGARKERIEEVRGEHCAEELERAQMEVWLRLGVFMIVLALLGQRMIVFNVMVVTIGFMQNVLDMRAIYWKTLSMMVIQFNCMHIVEFVWRRRS